MKRLFAFITTLSLFFILPSCDDNWEDRFEHDVTLDFFGKVLDLESGEAIPNAEVVLYENGLTSNVVLKVTFSDSLGKYEITKMTTGPCVHISLRAYKTGYDFGGVANWVGGDRINCSNGLQEQDFLLRKID